MQKIYSFFTIKKQDLSLIFANILDNYDAYLYGFMAPIMAPLFFPKQEYVVQLILAYGLFATSSITRPLGTLIFGWLACRKDPWYLLRITLFGVGVTTLLIGFLPTHVSIGYWAAILLFFLRMMNGIFAAGEKALASLWMIIDKPTDKAITTNAWYESSVMWGITAASWISSLVSQNMWRAPFLLGGVLVLYTLFLRNRHTTTKAYPGCDKKHSTNSPSHRISLILTIVFSMGFSYVTYDIPLVFMNSFVPLITAISYQDMMFWNTILLIIDMFLGIFLSYLIRSRITEYVQIFSAFMLSIPSILMFHFMPNSSLMYVLFVRCWIVLWGVIFACVLNVRLLQLFPYANKYLLIGFWGSIGATFIGRSTSPLCLWGWHKTNVAAIPGIYLCGVAMFVLWALHLSKKSVTHKDTIHEINPNSLG